MTGPSPDLDALREKAEMIREACPCCNPFGDEDGNDAAADQILAVLALVDEQRARISTLEKNHLLLADCFEMVAQRDTFHQREWLTNVVAEARALAGSPAENKEQS